MVANKNAISALAQNRVELEEQTHTKLLQAITRIKNGVPETFKLKPAGKVTGIQLAKEAGVSRASLYGNHKIFLEELIKINSKRSLSVSAKRKLTEKKAETDKEIIKQLSNSRELLAQENYRINEENKRLKREIENLNSQLYSAGNVIPGKFNRDSKT
ncbi:hypothetical protein [Methylophilus sp. 14]|uniref:hypothetical protein n=1 Tax=Methylophilus sp. 14 TaxID=2781019 RepID=UPI00188F9EB8|nr:hypothetical protein [Methylophilus sp. 14]MBF4989452.1 hypothetical protein [Methylophilus sp. 14]